MKSIRLTLQLYLLLHGVRCVGSLRSRRHPDMLASLASLEPLASLALCAPLRYTAHIRTLNRAIRLGTRYARFRIVCLVLALPHLAPSGSGVVLLWHIEIAIGRLFMRCVTRMLKTLSGDTIDAIVFYWLIMLLFPFRDMGDLWCRLLFINSFDI
jgi:hypothetical protein